MFGGQRGYDWMIRTRYNRYGKGLEEIFWWIESGAIMNLKNYGDGLRVKGDIEVVWAVRGCYAGNDFGDFR